MKKVGIIPARMKSSRFPGKLLKEIEGLPMVVHVFKRAELCEDLDEVYVATDTEEIFEAVEKHGGRAIMTSEKHQTGTDRIAEAVQNIECDIVVNIQGDEPLLIPDHIGELLKAFADDENLEIATLMCKTDQFNQVSECKMVVDFNNYVLYFSREDIPSTARVKHDKLYKLYNIIGFKKDFLLQFSSWELTPLEKIEYIEYLRAIEHGHRIKAVLVESGIQSVDTPEELETVKNLMREDKIKHLYA